MKNKYPVRFVHISEESLTVQQMIDRVTQLLDVLSDVYDKDLIGHSEALDALAKRSKVADDLYQDAEENMQRSYDNRYQVWDNE